MKDADALAVVIVDEVAVPVLDPRPSDRSGGLVMGRQLVEQVVNRPEWAESSDS